MNRPSEKDVGSLITLLEDEDQEIVDTIAGHLVTIGTAAVPYLTEATATQPTLAPRIEPVVEEIRVNELGNAFLGLLKHGETKPELEVGAFLIAQFGYPNLDVPAYTAKLDAMAKEARERIDHHTSSKNILDAFNHYFFVEQGFHGNSINYDEADNSFLNRIIDRRTGIPIGLSVLYILIGSRLDLPLHGVSTPGHFLVKFDAKDYKIFIDCFNGGTLLTDKDCARFLIRSGYGFKASYLHRSPARAILTRMLKNLIALYQTNDQPAKATQLKRFIKLLQHRTSHN